MIFLVRKPPALCWRWNCRLHNYFLLHVDFWQTHATLGIYENDATHYLAQTECSGGFSRLSENLLGHL